MVEIRTIVRMKGEIGNKGEMEREETSKEKNIKVLSRGGKRSE